MSLGAPGGGAGEKRGAFAGTASANYGTFGGPATGRASRLEPPHGIPAPPGRFNGRGRRLLPWPGGRPTCARTTTQQPVVLLTPTGRGPLVVVYNPPMPRLLLKARPIPSQLADRLRPP